MVITCRYGIWMENRSEIIMAINQHVMLMIIIIDKGKICLFHFPYIALLFV